MTSDRLGRCSTFVRLAQPHQGAGIAAIGRDERQRFFFAKAPRSRVSSAMLALMFRLLLPLTALTMLGACHQIEPAPPPLHPQGQAVEANPDPPVFAANTATPADHAHDAPAGAIVPRASVEQVEPGQEALAQAIITASKPSLDECRANAGGGTLRLRVVGSKTSAKITIAPGSTVNDSVRHCVLEALSTLDVPDTLSQSSPSMKPSAGFSSTIAVNW